MEFTAKQIAELLGGEVVGDENSSVSTVSKIEEGKPGSLTFLANPQYTSFIYQTNASAVIVNSDFEPEKPVQATLIKVPDARAAFAQLLEVYQTYKNNKEGIEENCHISETAVVGDGAYIASFAYIGERVKIGNNVKIYPNVYVGDDSTIGDNTTLYAGVKVFAESIIGSDCTIHGGCSIGADGFGFAPNAENQYNKVAQIGNVIVEDHVEIGANCTIDRATLGSTIIRRGVKLDNLIQVAHNVEIGENTVIAAQTGIAGSTKIGKNCMIGGQVGIIGHLTIGDNVKIAAQSGIGKNIPNDKIMQGSPAFEIGDYTRAYAVFRRLPDFARKLNQLMKKVDV